MQRSIFWSENVIYHLLPKIIFSPSHDTSFLNSYWVLCAIIRPYFAFILLFTSYFLFFFPLSFSFTFSPFFSSPFFRQMISADIPPLPGGRGILQYIDPEIMSSYSFSCRRLQLWNAWSHPDLDCQDLKISKISNGMAAYLRITGLSLARICESDCLVQSNTYLSGLSYLKMSAPPCYRLVILTYIPRLKNVTMTD
jgi:hypothetical protein